MKLIDLFEEMVTLHDLYYDNELNDESEEMYHVIDEDDLTRSFPVHTMSPEQAKQYLTAKDDTTVWDAYNKFATKNQKN